MRCSVSTENPVVFQAPPASAPPTVQEGGSHWIHVLSRCLKLRNLTSRCIRRFVDICFAVPVSRSLLELYTSAQAAIKNWIFAKFTGFLFEILIFFEVFLSYFVDNTVNLFLLRYVVINYKENLKTKILRPLFNIWLYFLNFGFQHTQ